MKNLYCFCLSLSLLLLALEGFSQPVNPRPNVVATVMDNDTWCHVEWPGPPWYWEIAFDDGEADDYFLWSTPGNMSANRFTPTGYPVNVYGGRINVGDGSFPGPFLGSSFRVLVYDDDGENGMPGTALDSMDVTVNNYGWVEFYGLTATIAEGDFYLAMKQMAPSPDAAPVGVDLDNPTYFKSYVHFVGAPGWVVSPLQDFMIRAWTTNVDGSQTDIDYYQVDRFSNFDPCGDSLLGNTTILDTTFVSDYHDYDWAGLPQGWYAYGVKTHYTSGEWSDYEVSNMAGHFTTITVTININLCDTTWSEYTVVMLNGEDYPIDIEGGYGTLSLEFNYPCGFNCDIDVCCPGNDCYFLHNQYITTDKVYNIVLSCSAYPIRNLMVDPVALNASWDPPQVVALDEDFEPIPFPPMGWQTTSEGNSWFRTNDGSSAGWTIPGWYSHYACTNDLLAGNGNNGSQDYLITPGLNLKYRYNNFLSFYSYFDGSNGQEAYLEYSFDGSDWTKFYDLDPSGSWEKIELDMYDFSGPESEPVWFAFHSDDNGQDASGWAIDSVRVYSPEPPYTLDGYWVFLNDTLVGTTATTFFDLPPLTYGEEYSLKVKAHYPSGLSSAEPVTFISHYLNPPSCFYQADTGIFPFIMCPPMDSTGAIPPGFLGYNVYRDGDFVGYIQYLIPPPPGFWFDDLQPGIYQYGLSAVYDLTSYGYPGETGESMGVYTDFIVRYGYPLPFLEQWNLGTFETNNWQTDGPNWAITGQAGNPLPSAEFSWDPILTNYESSLTSYPFQADSMIEGQIYVDFDVKLNSVVPTGNEFMLIQVWNWESQEWATADTLSNIDGSFDWMAEHIDITSLAMGQIFKIRFSAQGENSINILNWLIDNINVYRTCNPPSNLTANFIGPSGITLNWESPEGIPVDQWIHWDDGVNSGNSVGGPMEFSVAARWEPAQLTDYGGATITQIAFFPGEESATYNVRVWTGVDGTNLVVDQPVLTPIAGQWNTITLTTPLPIDITQELWVGYYIYAETGYPAGVDDGPAIDGYGNMIYYGKWWTLLEINPDLDYNWNIVTFLEQAATSDSIDKYAIYRSDEYGSYFLRAYSEQEHFVDNSLLTGFYCYYVTALYISGTDTCESSSSNETCLFVGINEKVPGFSLNIFPIPSKDFIWIESSEEIKFVILYNSFGELILKKKVDERQLEIPVSDYPAGVYMIRVETGGRVISKKVMVVH